MRVELYDWRQSNRRERPNDGFLLLKNIEAESLRSARGIMQKRSLGFRGAYACVGRREEGLDGFVCERVK